MRIKLFFAITFLLAAALEAIAVPPVPKVSIVAPPQVLLGEKFTFTVTFESDPPITIPPTVGFAPTIDIVWDFGGADHNNPPPLAGGPCDGFSVLSAEMIDVNGGPIALPLQTSPPACGSTAPVPHPFGASPFGPVIVPMSARMTTVALPFGSFESTQPTITVKFTAQVHNFADAGHPLFLYARGSFRYGNDALDNPVPDPPILTDTNLTASAWTAHATVTPTLFIVSKTCLAPEGETATGPNYTRQCEVSVDVASGQTITDLIVTDCLSSNMQYVGLNTSVTTPGYTVLATPPSCLKLKYPSVTGVAGPEIKVAFNFYVPLNDSNGPVLDRNSCTNPTSVDDAKAEGDWLPLDPRDVPSQHLTSNVSQYTLTDKRITIQKSVKVMPVPPGPIRPGKLLQWTIDLNISDYFTVGRLSINDLVGDGQDLLLTTPYLPTLTVSDRRKPPPTNVPLVVGQTITSASNPWSYCKGVKGGTTVMFNISLAMQNNSGLFAGMPVLQAGILTGGYAFLPVSNVPATARIVFYTRVRDTFIHPQTPGDQFVDKDDPINNCVDGGGTIYTNDPVTPQPVTVPPLGLALGCSDDSSASVVLPGDVLQKTVYGVKRGTTVVCGPSGPVCSNSPNPPQQARPGDTVTFRLRKPAIPSSDAEKLTVEDWLPLPIFDVSDPNADLVSGPPWIFTNTTGITQNPGTSHLLPTDTLHSLVSASTPLFTPDLPTNSIKFDYGSFNDTSNNPRAMDLVFTSTVTPQPFADGLFFTNVARECESNTFGTLFCQVAIAQVNVRQPNLKIQKGVVGTDNPNGVFTPALNPAGKWKAFGTSCPRFNPTIDSTNLGGLISSNLSNVDANDWVTFAIAVENIGGAPAYDIELADIIPVDPSGKPPCMPSCFLPDYSGLCIRRGDGVAIPFTTAPGGGGSTIIKLPNPLPPAGPPGVNIVIITFNAQLLPTILPGCCDNVAELTHYASQPGGPNFVSAGFTPPFTDSATVCVNPILAKSVVATSEPNTTPQTSASGVPKVAIGEIVRYRIATAVPEGGMLLLFQVTDALPAGMKFMNDGSARLAFVSNTNGSFNITHTGVLGSGFDFIGNETTLPFLGSLPAVPAVNITGGATCGAPVTFKLGTIQNNDNDTDLEFVVIEFNALVCNVASNTNNTPLPNTFSVSVNGNQFPPSNPVNVLVVEPKLDVQKTFTPANPTSPACFTVTLTNTGTTDAFDVHLTDSIPNGLTLSTFPPPNVTVSPTSCATPTAPIVLGSTITVDVPRIPASPSCTITLKFWVQGQFCGTNTAQVSYSSLPGGVNSHPAVPVGTQPNSTGSVTPCHIMTTQEDCERIYNGSGQATVNCSSCTQAPQGMVSWWPGDGNATDIQDGNHGTLVNGATFAPGKVGLGFSFGGTGDYVEIPHSPTLDLMAAHAVDLWVKVAAYPPANTYAVLVNKWVYNLEDKYLSVGPAGNVFYYLVVPFGAPLASSTSLTPGNWYHIAGTYDGTTAKIYINGVLDASKPASGNTGNSTGKLYFGHNPDRVTAGEPFVPFKGQLDEIEWFNRALSAAEITAIFKADSAGKCKCLAVSNGQITCNPNGTFGYTFTVTNLSGSTVTGVNFSSASNLTVIPNAVTIPPLPPGGSTTVTVTIGGAGAVAGSPICFSIVLVGPPPAQACKTDHCVTLTCQTACAPRPPRMVAWWPMGLQGGSVNDIAPAPDSLFNNVGFSPAFQPVFGNVGGASGALFFGGPPVQVQPQIELDFAQGNFSIDAWIRIVTVGPGVISPIVDKFTTPGGPGFAFYVRNQKLELNVNGSTMVSTAPPMSFANPVANTGPWYHVAVTVQRAPAQVIFYINGVPQGTSNAVPAASVNSGLPLLIGGSRLILPGAVQGAIAIDELELFKSVLTQAQIQAIVNAGSVGKCP